MRIVKVKISNLCKAVIPRTLSIEGLKSPNNTLLNNNNNNNNDNNYDNDSDNDNNNNNDNNKPFPA